MSSVTPPLLVARRGAPLVLGASSRQGKPAKPNQQGEDLHGS